MVVPRIAMTKKALVETFFFPGISQSSGKTVRTKHHWHQSVHITDPTETRLDGVAGSSFYGATRRIG